MTDVDSLQKQVDTLSSALSHVIEAMRSLHDLEDLSRADKRVTQELRVAIDNMNELNRLRTT